MKRYKRRNPLIPLQKMVVVILCVALAAVLAWLLTGESAGTVACCGVLAALVVAYLFVAAGAAHRYAYCGDHIKLLYLMIPYQKYRYDAASSICISNAAYNNGYGYGPNGSIPMQYKSGGKKGLTTVFPFITLHGKDFPIHRIHAGMTSREIFMLAGEKSFCLILWRSFWPIRMCRFMCWRMCISGLKGNSIRYLPNRRTAQTGCTSSQIMRSDICDIWLVKGNRCDRKSVLLANHPGLCYNNSIV